MFKLAKILLLGLIILVGSGLVFGSTITGCGEITDANLGQTLTLSQDISGWTGSCFDINFNNPQAGDSNYLTIDGNGHTIDSNTSGYNFLDMHNYDINSIRLINFNFNINYTDIIANGEDINYIDMNNIQITGTNNNILRADSSYKNSYLSITLGNFNSQDISFADLNLDLNFSNYADENGSGDYFLGINEGSYINNITFTNSYITSENTGNLFYINNNAMTNLTIDGSGLNLYDLNLQGLIIVSEYGSDTITLNNINASNVFMNALFLNVTSNPQQFNIFNSYISDSGAIFFIIPRTQDYDFNFAGSSFNLNADPDMPYMFLFSDSGSSVNIGDINIYNLNLISDGNLLSISDANASALNITDSNINIPSLINVDYDANIESGIIYNNILRVSTNTEPFIADSNRLNISLNTTLQQNKDKREMIISDASNYIGGNLWLDSNGAVLCTTDNITPFGICDNSLSVPLSDGSYITDNYPLFSYNPASIYNPPSTDTTNTTNIIIYIIIAILVFTLIISAMSFAKDIELVGTIIKIVVILAVVIMALAVLTLV